MLRILALVAFAIIALAPIAGQAGTTGMMMGATSGAEVESTVTDARGTFTFISLVSGTYALSVARAGFTTVAVLSVVVLADQRAVVHAQLRNPRTMLFLEGPWRFPWWGDIGGPRIGADVYDYRAVAPLEAQPNSNALRIRLTPGVVGGHGLPMPP